VADPTRVVTRRCIAFMVDAVVVVIVFWLAAQASRDFVDVPGDCPDQVPAGEACFQWRDEAYLIDGSAVVWFMLTLAVLLTLVLGVTRWRLGASLGKALLGIRVVDTRGEPAGFWRGAVRTAALTLDLIVLVLPIGLWLALLTPGHRRVGDFLAGTSVVRRAATPPDVTPPSHPATLDP
jgi:uncharacterized RDD family membrane protein YckC